MLEPEGLLVDCLADVVEFVEDKPTASAYIEQLCIFVVGTVDCLSNLQHEILVLDL